MGRFLKLIFSVFFGIFLFLLCVDLVNHGFALWEFQEIKEVIARGDQAICSGEFRERRLVSGFVKCFINQKTKSLLVYFYDDDDPEIDPWLWIFEDRHGEVTSAHD